MKRALLSVSDKTGIVSLAKTLERYGYEIISTGGTYKVLEAAGVRLTEISAVTGNPEAFGGRMKTISFQVESALLFDRERDAQEAANLGIQPIDIVVCNLYPFEQVLKQGADFETLIENIDIGGPTMIRSAAKNFKSVTVVTAPTDYAELVTEMEQHNGATSLAFRQRLMAKAFNHTADYDSLIATTMDKQVGIQSLRMAFDKGQALRYGENSHQQATLYRAKSQNENLYDLNVFHGKALSFNNILDINGAIESVRGLTGQACAIIKHNNPCGLCEGRIQRTVLEAAWGGDPISAFGSIIAFNHILELETVQFFELDNPDKSRRKFVEVVIAPSYTPEALTYLQQHKDLRIIQFNINGLAIHKDYRFLNGALLEQDADTVLYEKMEVVTQRQADLDADKPLIAFGLHAIKNIKSNTIVIVRRTEEGDFQLLGMGAGQPNRLISTKLAIEKCKENLSRTYTGADLEAHILATLGEAWLISDAFFPFADNVEIAAAAGIQKIVQPGGSIRDKSVIQTADHLGITMVFTGTRHFKH